MFVVYYLDRIQFERIVHGEWLFLFHPIVIVIAIHCFAKSKQCTYFIFEYTFNRKTSDIGDNSRLYISTSFREGVPKK